MENNTEGTSSQDKPSRSSDAEPSSCLCMSKLQSTNTKTKCSHQVSSVPHGPSTPLNGKNIIVAVVSSTRATHKNFNVATFSQKKRTPVTHCTQLRTLPRVLKKLVPNFKGCHSNKNQRCTPDTPELGCARKRKTFKPTWPSKIPKH